MNRLLIDQIFFGGLIIWAVTFCAVVLLLDLKKVQSRIIVISVILWLLGVSWFLALWLVK